MGQLKSRFQFRISFHLAPLLVLLVPAFAVSQSETELTPSTNLTVFDQNTPVELDNLKAERELSGSRPWRAPNFSDQENALGWTPEAFAVPAGLERQVQFWREIYSRYTTQQGVIHDTEFIDLVYEVVDFSEVEKSTGLPSIVREKLKKKIVDDAKQRALDALNRLAEASSPESLSPSDRKIWDQFALIGELPRIRDAAQPNRIRFQLGQKDRMESAIFLSGRYFEDFERIFRENGLPIELTRLVLVESSFNVLARSKVGASGLWQIMPATAKPHRLISSAVDNRNQPLIATRVAARVLLDSYKRLKAWPLAVTGYNHGPTGVQKIVEKYETRELGQLVREVRSRKSFGFASRNFYASFLAALDVERNAPKYFPGIQWSQKLDAEEIRLPQMIKYADLLRWFDGDDRKTQIFNPHLTSNVRSKRHSIPVGTTVSVPREKYNIVLASLGRKGRGSSTLMSAGTSKTSPSVHRVSRGENLTSIARDYGVSLRDLLSENDFKHDQTIVPGQKIRIPR